MVPIGSPGIDVAGSKWKLELEGVVVYDIWVEKVSKLLTYPSDIPEGAV